MNFKTMNGTPVDIRDEVLAFVSDQTAMYYIYLGSDSQVHRSDNKTVYATVVVLHKEGKGGRILLKKEDGQVLKSLRERLMRETWSTIEVAMYLNEILPKNAELILHVDSNRSKKFKSGNYMEELVGIVTSSGFQCRVKPDAWAAQTIANRFTK